MAPRRQEVTLCASFVETLLFATATSHAAVRAGGERELGHPVISTRLRKLISRRVELRSSSHLAVSLLSSTSPMMSSQSQLQLQLHSRGNVGYCGAVGRRCHILLPPILVARTHCAEVSVYAMRSFGEVGGRFKNSRSAQRASDSGAAAAHCSGGALSPRCFDQRGRL